MTGASAGSIEIDGSIEKAVIFDCAGCDLLGILTIPARPIATGVVIVVGGAQYRVGSHRQFTLLARRLAKAGIASMRFDYRGMGDSEGIMAPGVGGIEEDIRVAIDTFLREVPEVRTVALWGLCGAASASVLYGPQDSRVTALAMLNPWVRTAGGQARAQIKHYYSGRLRDPETWRRLLRGDLNVFSSVRSMAGVGGRALHGVATGLRSRFRSRAGNGGAELPPKSLPVDQRVTMSMLRFKGRILLILSGDDLTANEFRDTVQSNPALRSALETDRVDWHDLPGANHTFSSQEWREQVEKWTTDWLLRQA